LYKEEEYAVQHEIDGNDNNGQRKGKVESGEHKKGRLSQIKNDQPHNDEYETQYVNKDEHYEK
jgi:hypothetical protein